MNLLAEKLQKYHVILGSASARRKELLAGLDIPFEVRVKETNEFVDKSLALEEIPQSIAEQKFAALIPDLTDNDFLITADTLVFCGDRVIGKPKTVQDAFEMIRFLSGKKHIVVTGVCYGTKNHHKAFRCKSQVTFSEICDQDISYYIEKYKPMDKAGAYGVQEWIGYMGIEKIKGSYYNVMGLPVHMLYKKIVSFR